MIVLGCVAIVIGIVQTVATLSGGNGVWLHLEAGGPGPIMGGMILIVLGWYVKKGER